MRVYLPFCFPLAVFCPFSLRSQGTHSTVHFAYARAYISHTYRSVWHHKYFSMIENEGKHFLFQIMIITNGSELGIALLFKIYFSDANVNLKKKNHAD